MTIEIRHRADLDIPAIDRIAHGERVELGPDLLVMLTGSRAAALRDLTGDQPVYGVDSGQGAHAGVHA